MRIKKRILAKYLLRKLSLESVIDRLSDVVLEIKHDSTSENILSSRARQLVNLLRIPSGVSLPPLVRYGSKSDGGYSLIEVEKNAYSLLSYGVGDDISFEIDLSKTVSRIALYDFSVSKLPIEIPNATFHQIGISATDTEGFITVEESLSNFDKLEPLILKMDIEGYEWDILNSLGVETFNRFDQIVIEYHGLAKLFHEQEFARMNAALSKIRETHLPVVVHANNYGDFRIIGNVPIPDVVEVTYVSKLKFGLSDSTLVVTEQLDYPNNPIRPDIYLSFK